MENNDIIENIDDLPAEEQARLVAESDARLEESNEQMRRENEKLEAKNRRLAVLVEEQKAIVNAMERLAEQSRRNRDERESLMAS